MTWQPIDTFVKDDSGTVVDLYVNGQRYANCYWRNEGWATGWFQQMAPGPRIGFKPIELNPSHWMPLPEPPKP